MSVVLIILIAIFTDTLLGEPRKWHPLAGFGLLATRLERLLLDRFRLLTESASAVTLKIAGLIAWCCLILPAMWLISEIIASYHLLYWFGSVAILYLCIGHYSLGQHAMAVVTSLQANDIHAARQHVAFMVSRDTQHMNEADIATATIESVLENGCDAVFGALFWFLILGAPGAVMYRLANTLDAMWGYRSPRYRYFGWASVRIDDVLNWIPAQLTALAYAVMGNFVQALRCWLAQAPQWKSINAGSVMASGAGALGLLLGGAATYQGKTAIRPALGRGSVPTVDDIARSIKLVQRSLWLWLIIIFSGGVLVHGTWW